MSLRAIFAFALLLALPAPALAQSMSFRLVPAGDPAKCRERCLEMIAAEGEIVSSTPQAFIDFVTRNLADRRVRSVVLFHSPGGDVRASLNLGLMLRKIGAATVVARAAAPGSGITAGRCYSACVYALMGGKRRIIPPGSKVGIHRAYSIAVGADPAREPGSDIRIDSGSTGAAIARYSDLMGISRGLIDTAQKTLPGDIHIVSPEEIARWRLGTPKF